MCDTLISPRSCTHTDSVTLKKSLDVGSLKYTKPLKYTSSHIIKAKEISEVDNGRKLDQEDLKLEYDLKDEKVRLLTFRGWPHKFIKGKDFAEAGFYFLHLDDAVRCPWCGIEGHNWKPLDNPMEDHRKWSPNCSFVLERERDGRDGTVTRSRPSSIVVASSSPLAATSSTASSPVSPTSRDVCGNYEFFPNSLPEDKTTAWLIKTGIVTASKPCSYPEYSTYQSRIESFETWPKSLKQRPDVLSDCGFFYKGGGDQTLCYHCGGGLKDWEEMDDPWEQHAAWFPECQYLLLKRGKEYVDKVQLNRSMQKDASLEENESVESKEQKNCLSDEDDERANRGTPLCKVCYKNDVGVLFIPCGHVVCCVDCSLSINKTCPLCRKPFEATVRAFVP